MAKTIKLKSTQAPKTKKPVEVKPAVLLFIQAKGKAKAVTKSYPRLHKFLSKNERLISDRYRAYRNVPPIGQTEHIDYYKKRVPVFPTYPIAKEEFAAIKAETRCTHDMIWICLNNPSFPIAVIHEKGELVNPDLNELIKQTLLEKAQ